ncbi:MAG: hypothetical protein CMJ78_05335 [Planctomycetaceae bacterium]|nr:hypothetical protein [Planctomycetaceae bacterium]
MINHLKGHHMNLTDLEILHRLGKGDAIDDVCRDAGIDRGEFDAWWQQCVSDRVPAFETSVQGIHSAVNIDRDDRGIPNITAENDEDLFFGYGVAMAEDRLFQLDYLRRKGSGRLAEVLGPDGVELDLIARTVGLHRIATAEWERLPEETQVILNAFPAGINTVIERTNEKPPIEFDLLNYRAEPWIPIDCLVIESEFRWYLTGRFPVIAMPELAKRVLGEGPLFDDFLLGEADDEAIMPEGTYTPARDGDELSSEAIGQVIGGPDEGTGSNNWVVSGRFTQSGKPMVASDPHIAFEAVSCWYQAHLKGGSFNVVGMSYVGIPAIMFGRNPKVAWSITNNICSQRDLYQEQTDEQHPGCFLFDGKWEPARELTETINVKGGEKLTKTIRFSRNGPIVDEILPPPANETGPVSLKWLGAYQGGWLTALLNMGRSNTVEEFSEALRPWHVPTFCLLFGDTVGKIGFKASGRIPLRRRSERGYRRGWDPIDQWTGLLPFESMPGLIEPDRGFMSTANHRLVADDYPYPVFGTWANGYRGQRIREMIESKISADEKIDFETFRSMQYDTESLRAVTCLLSLIKHMQLSGNERLQEAAELLKQWDGRTEPESAGPTIFNVFFTHWAAVVAEERFEGATAEFLTKATEGIASRLIADDPAGWFANDDRQEKLIHTMTNTINYLSDRFGSDMRQWTWSQLHKMPLKHVISGRGELSQLLDHGGTAVSGDYGTVCNTGSGVDWIAASGAGFRMIADLSTDALSTIDGQSQSGNPGCDHYSDELQSWINGRYGELSLS